MHLVTLHRTLYRFAPQSVRTRLKDSMPFGVQRFPLFLPDGQALLLDHLESSKILRRFAWKGIYGYEPDTLRLFFALAKRVKTVLDIGAYFGLYSLIAAKANPQASIHAFEPLPGNLELLRHFLALNASTQVSVHPLALAQHAGDATLYIPRERRSVLPATGSLKDRFQSGQRFEDLSAQTCSVRTLSLDAWAADTGIGRVDLVKIDTEETEHEVIAGAMQTLAQSRPDIVMEITFDDPNFAQALAMLRALGYRFFHINRAGLWRFDEQRPAQSKRIGATADLVHCEILCTCRDDADVPRY